MEHLTPAELTQLKRYRFCTNGSCASWSMIFALTSAFITPANWCINTALGSNFAVSDEDFASVINSQFEKNGWTVYRVHIGNPIKHHEKYLMLDQAYKGQKYLYPQLNHPNNEALVLALQQTGVRVGPNGFQKDKSGEKVAETEENRLIHQTDGTDAFDTLFIGMNFYG